MFQWYLVCRHARYQQCHDPDAKKIFEVQHGVRAAQQTGSISERFSYQHPLMLAPQLQSTRFHNSGGNAIQIDQLVAELAFAACHIQHPTTAA